MLFTRCFFAFTIFQNDMLEVKRIMENISAEMIWIEANPACSLVFVFLIFTVIFLNILYELSLAWKFLRCKDTVLSEALFYPESCIRLDRIEWIQGFVLRNGQSVE